jgi:hypothetical protein
MGIFKETIGTRCLGDKNPECENYKNKTLLSAHKRHCPDPDCGSSVEEVTKKNALAIAVLVIGLAVLAGGIGYWFWSRLRTPEPHTTSKPAPSSRLTQSPVPVPTATSTSSSRAIPTPVSTATSTSSSRATPTPVPTATSTSSPKPTTSTSTPTPTPTTTQTPNPTAPPEVKPPPPPTVNEINRAIAKLEKMNPNEILEFPVEEKENYRVIGFKENETYYGWNVKNVKEFLEEGLRNKGQFPKTSQITLIIRNQSTNQKLVLKPISKNSPLGHFVRAVNTMPD